MHQERDNKHADGDVVKDGAVPAYLLDRQNVSRAKVRSGMATTRFLDSGFALSKSLDMVGRDISFTLILTYYSL